MLASNVLISLAVMVGLTMAAPHENNAVLRTRQNGRRTCIGGAISCEYGAAGRCAQVCGEDSVSSVCSCPDGTNEAPYTGAQCINIFTALGRYNC